MKGKAIYAPNALKYIIIRFSFLCKFQSVEIFLQFLPFFRFYNIWHHDPAAYTANKRCEFSIF